MEGTVVTLILETDVQPEDKESSEFRYEAPQLFLIGNSSELIQGSSRGRYRDMQCGYVFE